MTIYHKTMKVYGAALLIMFLVTGCNSGGDMDISSTSQQQVNVDENLDEVSGPVQAILGPLAGAHIRAYQITDLINPVEGPITANESLTDMDKAGSFSLSLSGISGDEWILLSATGGQDIDADDDGTIDPVPTDNSGTIRALAKAKDWRTEGTINILSELAYQQVKDSVEQGDTTDLESNLQYIADTLIQSDLNDDGVIDYQDLGNFKPSNAQHISRLKFDYQTLFENGSSGQSLIGTILNGGGDTAFSTEITRIFSDRLKPPSGIAVDITPPSFPGIQLIVANDADQVTMAWLAASDNVSSSQNISYQIHKSTTADFNPDDTTLDSILVGETSAEVMGLETGTTYYFLVVALDQAGNQSTERDYQVATTHSQPVERTDQTLQTSSDLHLGQPTEIQEDGSYTFASSADSQPPEEGAILVGTDSENSYLRKVESVSVSGSEITVQTSQAALTDLVKEGRVQSNIVLFDVNEAAANTDPTSNTNPVSGTQTVRSARYLPNMPTTKTMSWKNGLLTATQVDYVQKNKPALIHSSRKYANATENQSESAFLDDEDTPSIQLSTSTYNVLKPFQSLNLDVVARLMEYGESLDELSLVSFSAGSSASFGLLSDESELKRGLFTWTPDSSHISQDPYIAIFLASGRKKDCSFFCTVEVEVEVSIFVEGSGGYNSESSEDSNNSITMDADFSLKPSMRTDVIFSDEEVESAHISIAGNINFNATLLYKYNQINHYEATKPLFKRTFTSVYSVGVVPVIQEITFSLEAQFTSDVKAVIETEAVAKASSHIEFGVMYDSASKVWTPISSAGFDPTIEVQVMANGKLTAEVRLIPTIEVKFYKIATAGLSVEPYVRGEVAGKNETGIDLLEGEIIGGGYRLTKLDFFVGVDVNVYADLSVFNFTIFRYPEEDRETIWDDTFDVFSLPSLVINIDGAPRIDAPSLHLTAKTVDGIRNPFDESSIIWKADPSTYMITTNHDNRRLATFTPRENVEYTIYLIGKGTELGDLGRQYATYTVDMSDGDHDGIPSAWEAFYNLDPANSMDAISDNDGDLASNLDEYLAGTDPNDAQSTPELTPPQAPINIQATDGDEKITVSWDAVTDATSYTLFWSTTSGEFTNEQSVADITATSYEWESPNSEQTYYFSIASVNMSGTGDASTVEVSVVPNHSPTATITAPVDGTELSVSDSVTFTGSGNDQEDGNSVSLAWQSSLDGVLGTGSSLPWSGLSQGTHQITLTATDSTGATGSISVNITVNAGSTASPTASFTVAPSSGDAFTFQFDASASSDPEDATSVLQVRWDWSNDGEWDTDYSTTHTATHTYSSAGSHTVKMEVMDTSGLTALASQSITVSSENYTGETYTNSLGMTFNSIPSGTFMMGCEGQDGTSGYSCGSSESPKHEVTITQSFYMQTTEITQGQWRAVMGNDPSYFSNCGDDCPVEKVSWNDIQEFLTTLNGMGQGTYRLPTEAEWEYAARAGTTTTYSFGDDPNQLGDYAWYSSNSSSTTHPVATKLPNPWGLYDMHGNVWEWVQDWYNASAYSSHAASDPIYEESGSSRVYRGGSWLSFAGYSRSAFRYGGSPDNRSRSLGFRVVAAPPGL